MTNSQFAENQTSPHAAQLAKGFAKLRFEPDLEREFLQHYWTNHRRRIRIGLIVGIFIFLMFSLKDIIVYPRETWLWTVSTRCGFIIPVMLLALWPTFSARLRDSFAWASWVILTLVWAGFVAVLLEARAMATPLPYESMLLMMAFVFFMTGLRAFTSFVSCLPAITAYLIGSLMLGGDSKLIATQAFHLACMAVIGVMGAYSRELLLRKLFLTESVANFRAEHDSLTLLPNRHAAMRHFDTAWRQAARQRDPLAVFLLDVDHFKAYNDRYGHIEGDHCLQSVGQAIKSLLCRPMDIAARYGGEEFVALAYGIGREDAANIADRIRAAVESLRVGLADGGEARVTISIGVACIQPEFENVPAAIKNALRQADLALYSAKGSGRNRFVIGETGIAVGTKTQSQQGL